MAELQRNETGIGRRPALVVVDVSKGFTDPASPLGSEADGVVEAVAQLLAAFRRHGLPVFYTTVAYDSPEQATVFRAKLPALEHLRAGSEAVEIDPRVAPVAGEPVLVKHVPSGFFGTGLAQRLQDAGADTVFVTGLTTSGCVRATAVDALSHDFRVIVPREAVGDRDSGAHAANLHDIECKYGDVPTLDTALAALARWAAAQDTA